MPQIDFGQSIDIPGRPSQFVQLKRKGDSITFRLAGIPTYQGKHWISDTEWVPCPKVNEKKECEYCEKAELNQDEDEQRRLRAKVNFYFPILDRTTGKAAIFQTGLQVRSALEQYDRAGIDIYKSDWQVIRNEDKNPAFYYGVLKLDSKPLSKEDSIELAKAAQLDIEKITSSKSKSFPVPEEIPPLEEE